MKKSPKRRGKTYNSIQFESPLPAETAMARLEGWVPKPYAKPNKVWPYRVSSEKLDDTYYFEIRRRRSDWRPMKTIEGSIRELEPGRSLVECAIVQRGPLIYTSGRLILWGIILTLAALHYRSELAPIAISCWLSYAFLAMLMTHWNRMEPHALDPELENIRQDLSQ